MLRVTECNTMHLIHGFRRPPHQQYNQSVLKIKLINYLGFWSRTKPQPHLKYLASQYKLSQPILPCLSQILSTHPPNLSLSLPLCNFDSLNTYNNSTVTVVAWFLLVKSYTICYMFSALWWIMSALEQVERLDVGCLHDATHMSYQETKLQI